MNCQIDSESRLERRRVNSLYPSVTNLDSVVRFVRHSSPEEGFASTVGAVSEWAVCRVVASESGGESATVVVSVGCVSGSVSVVEGSLSDKSVSISVVGEGVVRGVVVAGGSTVVSVKSSVEVSVAESGSESEAVGSLSPFEGGFDFSGGTSGGFDLGFNGNFSSEDLGCEEKGGGEFHCDLLVI